MDIKKVLIVAAILTLGNVYGRGEGGGHMGGGDREMRGGNEHFENRGDRDFRRGDYDNRGDYRRGYNDFDAGVGVGVGLDVDPLPSAQIYYNNDVDPYDGDF